MFKDFQQLTIKIVELVNSPRKTQRIIRDATVPRVILKDFVDTIKLLAEAGLLVGSLSEVSLRTKGGKFLITPNDLSIRKITEESLLTAAINPDTINQITNLPRHLDWHREIYSKSKANAVVLCQPIFSCIAANRIQKPGKNIFTDADEIIDMMRLSKGEKVNFQEGLNSDGILLIQSVGILAWGKNPGIVLSRLETLERICQIEIESNR